MTSLIEKGKLRSTLGEAPRGSRRSEVLTSTQRDIAWTEMGQGVWVAKRGSDFAGLIEELWGAGYRVTDRHGAIIGEFATLQSARKHVL
jgi:hypothetical protein